MPKKNNYEMYFEKFLDFYRKNKVIPNFETLKNILWVASKSVVFNFMKKLEADDLIYKEGNSYFPSEKLNSVPVYSSVRAWFATPADEVSKDYLNIENYIIEHPNSSLIVKVKWDSMINASILEWDLVVIDKWLNPNIWDIIIAEVDWKFTLKYLQKDKKWRFYLKAWNENYPDIYPEEELQIFWVLVSVIRKIK